MRRLHAQTHQQDPGDATVLTNPVKLLVTYNLLMSAAPPRSYVCRLDSADRLCLAYVPIIFHATPFVIFNHRESDACAELAAVL